MSRLKEIYLNYKKGILPDDVNVFYCNELDEIITRPKVKKERAKALTKDEKKAIIDEFKQTNKSPDGYLVYFCHDVNDYKIQKLKETSNDTATSSKVQPVIKKINHAQNNVLIKAKSSAKQLLEASGVL